MVHPSGVERTNEFARAYGQVRGSSTNFETSVSVGFTASVSAGMFGVGVGAETSIDTTTTVGQTKSFEISKSTTNAIGNAVSSVITNDESITCEQSCGPNPENPLGDVQVSIFNWVDAVYEERTGDILHYVRTCSTVCKYDNVPPICPPGKYHKPPSERLTSLEVLLSHPVFPCRSTTTTSSIILNATYRQMLQSGLQYLHSKQLPFCRSGSFGQSTSSHSSADTCPHHHRTIYRYYTFEESSSKQACCLFAQHHCCRGRIASGSIFLLAVIHIQSLTKIVG